MTKIKTIDNSVQIRIISVLGYKDAVYFFHNGRINASFNQNTNKHEYFAVLEPSHGIELMEKLNFNKVDVFTHELGPKDYIKFVNNRIMFRLTERDASIAYDTGVCEIYFDCMLDDNVDFD